MFICCSGEQRPEDVIVVEDATAVSPEATPSPLVVPSEMIVLTTEQTHSSAAEHTLLSVGPTTPYTSEQPSAQKKVQEDSKVPETSAEATNDDLTSPADDVRRQPTPTSAADMDEDTKKKVDKLLEGHYVFEACAVCPEYVEAQGYLITLRETAQMMCGNSQIQWDTTFEGPLGDPKNNDSYRVQYRWGGALPEEKGSEYLWIKLAMDQGMPWWKTIGVWHEPEWVARNDQKFIDAYMVGDVHPTHAIRCELGGIGHKFLGANEDYLEVFRFLNRETGFCMECNTSIEREELEARGIHLPKAKYKGGKDIRMHTISFPRNANQCTAVLLLRLKLTAPRWLVNQFLKNLAPRFVKDGLPGLFEKIGKDAELQSLMDADKAGVHGYFKDFSEKALLAHGAGKYNALNLPPPEVVMGRWSSPVSPIEPGSVRTAPSESKEIASSGTIKTSPSTKSSGFNARYSTAPFESKFSRASSTNSRSLLRVLTGGLV